MNRSDAYERTVATLHKAMLDDAHWPTASECIEEACGIIGSGILFGEGSPHDMRVSAVGMHRRGEQRDDLIRRYLQKYHPIDERVPGLRRQRAGHLAPISEQYTRAELKVSPTYNELLVPEMFDNGLLVRLAGESDSHYTWNLGNPVSTRGWESDQLTLIKRLVPQVRQFLRVRQALVRAEARAATADSLLENTRVGVFHLDAHGTVLEANDRALRLVRDGDGLSDASGVLRASVPEDGPHLDRLLADALPRNGKVPLAGTMRLRRPSGAPRYVLHVKPAPARRRNYGARQVAALVLVVEPVDPQPVEPGILAAVLGLTPAEARVACGLAAGRTVREIALEFGHTDEAVYWHLKRMYRKLSISRQPELVRLVLSVSTPS